MVPPCAVGPEQRGIGGQVAEEALSLVDLPDGHGGVGLAQRHPVGERVVADPVPFGVGPLGQRAGRGIEEALTDDEERGRHAAIGQHVEHRVGHARGGPVVERERHLHRVTGIASWSWRHGPGVMPR